MTRRSAKGKAGRLVYEMQRRLHLSVSGDTSLVRKARRAGEEGDSRGKMVVDHRESATKSLRAAKKGGSDREKGSSSREKDGPQPRKGREVVEYCTRQNLSGGGSRF